MLNAKKVRIFMEKLMTEVGGCLKQNFGRKNKIYYKQGNEIVTNIDIKVEAIIKKAILKNYPGHSILSEENSSLKDNSEYLWIVDPLDGTNNFSRGIPIFGSAIALVKENEIIAAAIIQPLLNILFSADNKFGFFKNGKRTKIKPSAKGLIKPMAAFETRFDDKLEKQAGLLKRVFSNASIRIFGSSSNSFVFLLSGDVDIFVILSAHKWDVIAGAFLVKMAGGAIFNTKGEEWALNDDSIIAVNPKIKLSPFFF